MRRGSPRRILNLDAPEKVTNQRNRDLDVVIAHELEQPATLSKVRQDQKATMMFVDSLRDSDRDVEIQMVIERANAALDARDPEAMVV